MTKILHIMAPLLAILLLLLFFLYANTTSDLKIKINSFFLSGPCPSNSSINWVVTSGKLNLVQRTALESIFLHNPDACQVYSFHDKQYVIFAARPANFHLCPAPLRGFLPLPHGGAPTPPHRK